MVDATPQFTEAALHDLMINRLGYDPADAHGMVQDLLAMQPDIQESFIDWWQSGALPTYPQYEGHNPASMAAEYRLQPIAAFLTLDWLATEPDVALKALSEGYDEILPG